MTYSSPARVSSPTPLSQRMLAAVSLTSALAVVPSALAQPAGGTATPAATGATLPAVSVVVSSDSDARKPGDRSSVTLSPTALPATVQHIGTEDIANTNVGRDISNVFRRVPGVLANNIDQGETGNGFRMRGFATQGTHGADTAVYVDGVPQNIPSSQGGAGHGPAFLEWLTPDLIGGIDVVKGPVSALYGDQNRAGAVAIQTREGGDATPSSISVGAERYGLRRTTLVLSNKFSVVNSLLVADLYRNDGYRYASSTDRDSLSWKLSTHQASGKYSLRITRYVANFDAAGYLLLPNLEAGLDPRSTQANNPGFGAARRTSLVVNRAPADGEAGWYATAYAESFYRQRAITANATQHTVGTDDRDIYGARLFNNFTFGDAAVAVGTELRKDSGLAERRIYLNHAPTANYVNAQDLDLLTYGVFAQAQWRASRDVKLSAGARYDRFDYDIDNLKLPAASTGYRKGVFTPKLGVSWQAMPQLELFANVAEGMRSPAAEQISGSGSTGPLGAAGGTVSQVKPSKVRSYDLGFTSTPWAGWTVSGAGYYILNSDEIVSQADGSFKSVGDTTRKGFELETRWRMNGATSIYASVGRILEAKVNNPAANTGAKLSVPATQLKGGVQHKLRLASGQLTLNADASLVSDIPYYVGTPTTQERTMPLYTRYDLRATYDWGATQLSLYAVLQPHRFGTEIAYGSAAGLMVSPRPPLHGRRHLALLLLMAGTAPILACRHLTIRRGGRVTLNALQLSVHAGRVYALLGGNGAGKTTTLNALLGFVAASSGQALVDGIDASVRPHEARARLAYLPENVALYPYLTGVENLRYFCALSEIALSGDQARALLAGAGLAADAQDRRVASYSKGMRQKVGLAIAKARKASAMLLDEPTSGLDPSAANEFAQSVLQAKAAGMAVLMATHDLFNALQVADHIGILREGCLVADFAARDVAHAELERIYLLHARGGMEAVAP